MRRCDTAVAAVFRQIEDVTVGEPGQLGCELVAFARRGRDRHCEAVLEVAGHLAFEPSDMIDVGDDALADLAGDGAIKAMPPGDMSVTWQGNSRRSASM